MERCFGLNRLEGKNLGSVGLTFVDGVLYANTNDGYICAINVVNGETLWTRLISHFDSAPTLANGGFFVGSFDGTMHALNASSGVPLWNHTLSLYQSLYPIGQIYSWSWRSAVVGEAVYIQCRYCTV